MRLGQLARKLAVRQSEVVDYLRKNSIAIDESSNARIDDDHAIRAIAHFAPHLSESAVMEMLGRELEEVISEPATILAEKPESTLAEVPTPAHESPIDSGIIESLSEVTSAEEEIVQTAEPEPSLETVELIKAPKVELPGLKVVGKIELPQPKKKEEEATEGAAEGAAKATEEIASTELPRHESRERRNSRDRKKRQVQPRKNPVALQRERETREAERQKQEDDKRHKERKTSHYQNKIKHQGPTKAARIHDEDVVQMHEIVERPKSAWGKFLKWFWRE